MISVITGTFGSEEWNDLGRKAIASLNRQTEQPVSAHHVHAETLAEARNIGALEAEGEWFLFLDADDYIDDNFIKSANARLPIYGNADYLVRPAITVSGGNRRPHVLPEKNIYDANFMIIGTLVKRETFFKAGMFRDIPVLEDWDLWIRCVINGSLFGSSPASIYHINSRQDGRNNSDQHAAVFHDIRARYRDMFT